MVWQVNVAIRAGGQPVALTTAPPPAATASTTLNMSASLPRNECVTAESSYGRTFGEDCGYPAILGTNASGDLVELNASAAIGADGSSLVLRAKAPPGFVPTATAYGRASWPRTVFFGAVGGLPVLPWLADLNATDARLLPTWVGDDPEVMAAEAAAGPKQWFGEALS